MKQLLITICIATFFMSCKTEKKEQTMPSEKQSDLSAEISEGITAFTTAEKIAQAHGYQNWKNTTEIKFTFNVDRGESHFERSWTWNPKTDDVQMISEQDTIRYNRTSVDSLSLNADKGFINDKYWLFVPFQLVWDQGITLSESVKEVAPISKTELNKISITYGNEGGYTPGDAYDIFFDNDYLIREWVFRQGNSVEPSMTTTFENYEDFKGVKIAKDHKMADGNFNLYFSDINIK